MAKYGITWWGTQWLNALSHIDYSNRLPRGRSYANKGAVKDITFNKNRVSAKVQGTRPAPYKVLLKIPAFSTEEIESLTNEVLKNPLLISRLLNRELPHSLYETAKNHDIQLFPKRWDDLDMHCSCPDWAVPCKHLAAVINLIANEIDRNPFVIFKLHSFDIIAELKKRGITSVEEKIEISELQSLARVNGATPVKTNTETLTLSNTFDLSSIPVMRENLLALLNEKPVFYSSDFKVILDKIYRKSSRYVSRDIIGTYNTREQSEVFFEKYDHAEIHVSKLCYFSFCEINAAKEIVHLNTVKELILFLHKIPASYVTRLQDHLLFLYFSYHLALKLAEQAAMIPQLVILPDASYTIRWLPALINDQIRELHAKLVHSCPPDLLLQEETKTPLKQEEQVNTLISLFYVQIIKDCEIQKSLYRETIPLMFTENLPYRFDKLGETEIPGSIQRWTDKLYLSRNDFSPVLKISPDDDADAFTLEIFIENRKKALQQAVTLEDFMKLPEYTNVKFEVLRGLEMLTTAYNGLEHIIATSGKYIPSYSSGEFADIIFNILPVIRLYGIRIIMPDELKQMIRPRLSLSLALKNRSISKSFLSIDKILDFEYRVALGDTIISKEEFLNLVKGLSGIVRLKQQYVYLNQADLKSLMDSFSNEKKLNRHQLLQAAITGEYKGAKINIDKETQELIDSLMQSEKTDLPEGLNASLRPYQQRGYHWLYKNSQLGFGSIIADDMGLGKTLQVITLLLRLKQEDPGQKAQVLIIVPTTLLTNWQKEFDKFAPEISCCIYHGPSRVMNLETDVVLTSYGTSRSDQKELSKKSWRALIIDEAQNIKNASTAQSKAVKSLKSDIRIAMSGTPVENRLSEYWSIFDFTNHGYLGNQKHFIEQFAIPIELSRDQKKLARFLKITAPFILRRVKTDRSVISDLPDKIENDVFASLVKEQAAIYQNVLNSLMGEIEDVPDGEKDAKIQRKGLVLKMITALKQVCNHPSQYLKKKEYSPDLSGKAGVFVKLIENILETGDKVLVFTQYREMGIILQQLIREQFDVENLFLHGGTSRKMRDEMVEQFQHDPHRRIFILSLKAGGTGLNLTAANHVIHYDLWWNPAVEAQATDRAYRIGQNRNVMVHRLITKGTFEERIDKMLKDKKQLADLTVTSGEKWIGDLSNKELKTLFSLEH